MQFSINKKKLIIGVIGILVSILFIFYISKKIEFSHVIDSLSSVNLIFIVLMILIYISSFFLRALRWKLMLSNYSDLSFKQCFKSIVIGFAGNNFIPARGGELSRMEVFSRETEVNRITTISSVLVEKILDGLVLVFFLLIVLLFNIHLLNENWLKNLTLFASVLFVSILFLLVLFRVYGLSILSFLESKNKNIYIKLKTILSKIYSAILFIDWSFNSFKIVLLGLFIWLIECLVYFIALLAFNINDFPIYEALLTLSIVNFGLLVPSSPGYVGVFQGMTILALMIFSIDEETALSISILIHSCQFFPISILGLFYLFNSR